MSVFASVVVPSSLSVASLVVLLRFGPPALVILVAGIVATLARHGGRGERALAVLTLLHESHRHHRSRRPRR